jgi:UDP-glucose 4-epimerase
MILVTGGSGFIGSHTVRALADLGETCAIIQRRSGEVPVYLADLPVVSEQADVTDLDALRAVGTRHKITGIVHLAGYPAPRGTVGGIEATEDLFRGLFNIVRAASEWDVRRIGLASTIGVYAGVQHVGPLTEDMPVHLTAPHPIPRSKKIGELLGEQLAEATGIEIVNLRISGTWGPVGHEDPFFAAPALINAAASRSPLDVSGLLVQPHLGDGLDLCYVKDTGRAIALLQVAEQLHHRAYNVASGRLTTNADIIDAILSLEPGLNFELPQGATHPGNPLDITRLREDTGYQPEYDTARAVSDYIAWLRAGNSR